MKTFDVILFRKVFYKKLFYGITRFFKYCATLFMQLYYKKYSGTGVSCEFCKYFHKTLLRNTFGQLLLYLTILLRLISAINNYSSLVNKGLFVHTMFFVFVEHTDKFIILLWFCFCINYLVNELILFFTIESMVSNVREKNIRH